MQITTTEGNIPMVDTLGAFCLEPEQTISHLGFIAGGDIDLLRELNQFGTVRNLKDRPGDLFKLKKMSTD